MARSFVTGGVILAIAAFAPGADAQMGGHGGGGHGGHSQHQGNPAPPAAPSGPKAGDQINFCGKVVALVQDGCIGIVGKTQTVELASVTPKPAAGTIIDGSGVVSNDMNACMQGLHMRSATWKITANCSQ